MDGGGISGSATPTLSLANVSAPDAGEYTVVVTNSVGSRLSAAAALVLIAPPANGITNTFWDNRVAATTTGARRSTSGNWIDYNSPQGTPYYPDGTNYSVTLDNAGGTTANLNVSVTLNTLTLLNNGGLNVQARLRL